MPVVRLWDTQVTRTNLITYLWVTFNSSLCFKAHVDHVMTKVLKSLPAMRIMAAAQWLLVLLDQSLVLSLIEYVLAIITVSLTKTERRENVKNQVMRIIFSWTRDTSCMAMRYLIDSHTMEHRTKIWKVHAYLIISAYTNRKLHGELIEKEKTGSGDLW